MAALLTRINEDERNASAQHHLTCALFLNDNHLCDCGVPEGIVRWCIAGKRIVKDYEHKYRSYLVNPNQGNVNALLALETVLKHMIDAYDPESR